MVYLAQDASDRAQPLQIQKSRAVLVDLSRQLAIECSFRRP